MFSDDDGLELWERTDMEQDEFLFEDSLESGPPMCCLEVMAELVLQDADHKGATPSREGEQMVEAAASYPEASLPPPSHCQCFLSRSSAHPQPLALAPERTNPRVSRCR